MESKRDEKAVEARVLLVDDDKRLAELIAFELKKEAFDVDMVHDGRNALSHIEQRRYDLAIVDIIMPGLDGFELIQLMRNKGHETPILVLSAKREIQDRVRGLDLGCDDYLTKPFAISEMIARIRALMRRSATGAQQTTIEIGDLHVDLVKRTVQRAGDAVHLQSREFDLLAVLVINRGNLVSKSMILSEIWNDPEAVPSNVVESRMSRLRQKIDRNQGAKLIHTVRGLGYILKEDFTK